MRTIVFVFLVGLTGLCPNQAAVDIHKTQLALQDDCADCQTFVADAQQILSDPAEQQKATDLIVNQFCPLLQSVFPQCASYAQEYVPIGLQMLLSVSPSNICQTIGWCSALSPHNRTQIFHKLNDWLNGRKIIKSSKDNCTDCLTFITDAQKRYADPAEQQKIIDLVVNNACPFLATVFPQCSAYAKEYIPIGFQYLASYSPQQVCQAIDFCPAALESKSASIAAVPWVKIQKANKVGDNCDDCKKFAVDVQHFCADPQQQQQVIDFVTGTVCPIITVVFPGCVQFAKTEIPALFTTFQQLDPTTICSYIGLCSSFRLPRARLNRYFSSRVHMFQMAPKKPSAFTKSNDEVCDDCQTFFKDLLQYYSDPNNQQYIIDELAKKVCPHVSEQFPQCSQVISAYLPAAFQLLETLNPAFVCELGFCKQQTSVLSSFAGHASSRLSGSSSSLEAPATTGSAICTDCEVIAEIVRRSLQSSATVNALVERVTAACKVVAPAGQPMCYAMLGAALRELVYTMEHSTNQQVCATFFAQCAQ